MRRKGISNDSSTWNYKPPKLSDLLSVLESIEKKSSALEKTTVRSLVNRLSMYVTGVFSFFNQDTNIKFDNDLVCFDIGQMPKQVKPVIMFLILDYVYMKMRSDIERKVLVVDEAWTLLERAEDASYIFEIVKTCRKFNMGLLLINQEVEGLLNSKAGKSVLANSSYTVLMRQKPSVMRDIVRSFDLSSAEKNYLLTSSVGQGIMIMENDHTELKVVASPKEHDLITTKADEILEKQKPGERKDVNITVDEEKGFFRYDKMTADEVKYLKSKGYKDTMQYSIISKKKERYLLKPRFNESIQHFFLTMEIYIFLKQFIKDIKLYETNKPDVVFKIKKKKIAVEIETGKQLMKDRKRIQDKGISIKNEYDDGFFVLTDRNLIPKYKSHGKTIDKRYLLSHLRNNYLKLVRTENGNTAAADV